MIFRKKELRAMKNEELFEKLNKLKVEEAIERRRREATGKLTKGSKLRETRRTIARILTILHERGVA
jgi:large subunit ribosomal protein L29